MEFIPLINIDLSGNELKYLQQCIKENWISSTGRFVKEFEKKFANYIGTKYGVATSNGTAALHLALRALNIKQGDEVIIPDLTFISTANVVLFCNATPVFVDVDKRTWNIDPQKIKEAITQKTKAIIPVHLYGHPCDIQPIMKIAQENNLKVIEDCAEAHGAEYERKKVGSFGHINCFSFFGNKIITTGEGGMCITDDAKLDGRMRILRDHGMSRTKRYWHEEIGFNYRMTNMQAAVGLAQLERINTFIEAKRKNAQLYKNYLADIPNVTLPVEEDYAKNIYWMYSILLNKDFPIDRNEFIQKLKERGIDSRPLVYPCSTMPYHKDANNITSKNISKRGVSLPSSTDLTEEQIKFICNTIKELA